MSSLGIHHITAIASDPQQTVDFYTGILGLRLVKRSVNQDQTEAYHLFFGDTTGEPGMDLTFFTFPGAYPGKVGVGTVSLISLAINQSSLDFWIDRLSAHQVRNNPVEERFGLNRLNFKDFDGQHLELVTISDEEFSQNSGELWVTKDISKKHAIGYFYSARLSVAETASIDFVVKTLGFSESQTANNLSLFTNTKASRGAHLEILTQPKSTLTLPGSGTVHHIAFQVKDEGHLLALRSTLIKNGLRPTQVINRFYFKSVYFQTPAGILFELTTNGPGFTVDEAESTLGQTLKLPPWLEPHRPQIESNLPPIKLLDH